MSMFLFITIILIVYFLIGFIHAKLYYKSMKNDLGSTFYEDLSLDHSYILDKEELRHQASIFGIIWLLVDVFVLFILIIFSPYLIYKFLLKKIWK